MNLLRFVPVKLTFFLIAGILVGYYLNVNVPIALASTLLFLMLLGVLFIKQQKFSKILFGVVFYICTFCLGNLSIALWNPKNQADHYTHHTAVDKKKYHIKIREVLNSSVYSDRYIATLSEIDGGYVSGSILLSIAPDTIQQKLQIDHELIVFAKLSEINKPLNPHQFDYKNYLEKLGIYQQLRIPSDQYLLLENPSRTIYGIAASQRTKIITKLQQANFGTDELSIIKALLLGQRNDITTATYDNYKDAGAVHILAVSGLHIGILLLLLQFLLRPLEQLPKGKTIKLFTIVILLWCFALLAGLSASILRAVTMFSFVAYALYLNRPSNTFNILALSIFFILLVFNPMLIFQVGFQMSYAAVFSIVWIYPKLQRFWFPKHILLRKVWQLLSVSIAAQIGVLPISLFYFHQFPGLFFVSNLIVVPFLGVILGVGILVILLALINCLPDALVRLYNSLIGLMNTVIEWVAQQEAFIFKNITFDTIQFVLSFFIIISLVAACTKTTFRNIAVLFGVIICFQGWTFYASYTAAKKESLVILHQNRRSVVLKHNGNTLSIISNDTININSSIANYNTAERIANIEYKTLKNAYIFYNKNLIVIDSSGIYPKTKQATILLTESPKLNLDRLIDSIRPNAIIVDGSNYKSYIVRWKQTCAKRKLPFHYTGEKGAYYFD